MIPVDAQEVRAALLVCLKVMPKRIWEPYHRMLMLDPKRMTEDDRVDPREILATYLAAHFERTKWTACYPVPPGAVNGAKTTIRD